MTYPQVDAPRFRKGFIFSIGAFLAQFAITWIVWWFQRRDVRQKKVLTAEAVDRVHVLEA